MSIKRKITDHIGGFQVTAKVGDCIQITHASGDVLMIQVVATLSANQVKYALKADKEKFVFWRIDRKIPRDLD